MYKMTEKLTERIYGYAKLMCCALSQVIDLRTQINVWQSILFLSKSIIEPHAQQQFRAHVFKWIFLIV